MVFPGNARSTFVVQFWRLRFMVKSDFSEVEPLTFSIIVLKLGTEFNIVWNFQSECFMFSCAWHDISWDISSCIQALRIWCHWLSLAQLSHKPARAIFIFWATSDAVISILHIVGWAKRILWLNWVFSLVNLEWKLFILLDHLLQVCLALGGLFELQFFSFHLFFFLLDYLGEECSKILISAHIHRFAADCGLNFRLKLLDCRIFRAQFQCECAYLGWRINESVDTGLLLVLV